MNSTSLHMVSGNELVDSLKVRVCGLALRGKVFHNDVRWQERASGRWSDARAVRIICFSLSI